MIIGIACEDEGHFSTTTYLVDATLLKRLSWMDGIVESCRTWCGLDEASPWYKYSRRDANDLRPLVLDGVHIKPHGKIKGQALEPGAGMWRKVLMLFCHRTPRPDLVLLAHDMDGYRDRRRGMEQARDAVPWPFAVVLAAPQPEIEAWPVSGFVPTDEDEKATLIELALVLSFNPTVESHRLTSHPNDAPTDAKRVLRALCDDRERQQQCLADLALLRERGAFNGAKQFLKEVDEVVVPLFGHGEGSPN